MENTYKLPLVLDPQPEGGWTITCPVLPELITDADTWAEINPRVTDALDMLVKNRRELKLPMLEDLKPINQTEPILLNAAIPVKAR